MDTMPEKTLRVNESRGGAVTALSAAQVAKTEGMKCRAGERQDADTVWKRTVSWEIIQQRYCIFQTIRFTLLQATPTTITIIL